MAYLTFEEYEDLGYEKITSEEFDSLIAKASDFMDIQTRDFYQKTKLEDDIPIRQNKFKKAVALQIEYMYQSDSTSTHEANTPQTWSIGRTSVSEASRYSNTGKNETPSIISEDAIAMLSRTGLLYRGLSNG
ncbi:MAG: hypothetical protein RR494_08120 [Vagococcus sp.]|uniref:hypothetical protein n=1 Tax=Vagococcus sp. TaxID=1933889 RepID=UPI002FC9C8AF